MVVSLALFAIGLIMMTRRLRNFKNPHNTKDIVSKVASQANAQNVLAPDSVSGSVGTSIANTGEVVDFRQSVSEILKKDAPSLDSTPFIFDGIWCASFVSFKASLDCKRLPVQRSVCQMSAYSALQRTSSIMKYNIVYWNGHSMRCDSKEHKELLNKAYKALQRSSS
jgi:hypothetical protein